MAKEIRFKTTDQVISFKGIVSHVNFRKDKFDIGPAFDWERVIQSVQAENIKNGQTVEEAKKKFDQMVLDFQKLQVKIWESEVESHSDATALKAAEDALERAYDRIQTLERQPANYNNQKGKIVVETTKEIIKDALKSENEIENNLKYVSSRSIEIKDYGEEGPSEIPYDPFELDEEAN